MKNLITIITLLITVVSMATYQGSSAKLTNTVETERNTTSETTELKEEIKQEESKETKSFSTSSAKTQSQSASKPQKAQNPTSSQSKPTTEKEHPINNDDEIIQMPTRPFKEMEKKIIALVNTEREKAGVAPLKVADRFYNETLLRTNECIEYWSHTRPNGKECYTVYTNPYQYKIKMIGENLGKSFKTPEKIMEALMNSEGHRENILNKNFTHICVAIIEMPPKEENQNYTLYALTQHFYKMEESI